MRRINPELRLIIADDPYYKKCCLTGEPGNISLHHAFIYNRKQIDELWNIVPIKWELHDIHSPRRDAIHRDGIINKERAQLIALQRADLDDLCIRYPRYNWYQRYEYLNQTLI